MPSLQVFFHSAEAREPINCSHVPSRRWKSVCSVCKSTGGACVECTETGCQSTFHISCGLKEDLAIDYRDSRSGAVVISFCKLHTPTWNQVLHPPSTLQFSSLSIHVLFLSGPKLSQQCPDVPRSHLEADSEPKVSILVLLLCALLSIQDCAV
jgi:hypothetical protein